jgi:hypothetical protein
MKIQPSTFVVMRTNFYFQKVSAIKYIMQARRTKGEEKDD